MACTIVAKKLWISAAHIEAGLRSWDLRMPEEINRMVTDAICDLFFTTEPEGNENLLRAGTPKSHIHYAGNVMIDTLLQNRAAAEKNPILEECGVKKGEYALLTMHRPSNVDDPAVLGRLLDAFGRIQERIPMVFPAHPRTLSMIEKGGFGPKVRAMKNIIFRDPTDYHQTLKLNANSRFVLTDSGGLQEETTVLGVPCVTLREQTERPVTIEQGTNRLAPWPLTVAGILSSFEDAVARPRRAVGEDCPDGWDGRAAERLVNSLESFRAAPVAAG
jgi:UDP-N-acetylglucosamine 2-epimerase (non-hydrolysing)